MPYEDRLRLSSIYIQSGQSDRAIPLLEDAIFQDAGRPEAFVMLGEILIRPKRWLEGRSEFVDHRFTWHQLLIFFAIGIYGGFIQAGVGIFLLAGLVLGAGYDLVRGNAVKVLIVLCFTVFALAVFVINDQVVWAIGLILGIGNMLGAWVASRLAVERGAIFVRWVLIAVVAVSGAKLLGVFDWVGQLS